MSDFLISDYLIALAGLSYFVGYLVINQVVLRLLILMGTCFYIAFYSVAADEPLWGAILTSVAIGAANIFGLSILLMQRVRWVVPKKYRGLYNSFQHLQPGDFRRVIKTATHVVLEQETQLTQEGAPVDRVYLILSGETFVEKRNETFSLPEGVFVGEVAFLLGTPASATTIIKTGGEVFYWPLEELRKRAFRSARFKLALDAMISHDLANKVSLAVAPNDLRGGQYSSELRERLTRRAAQ